MPHASTPMRNFCRVILQLSSRFFPRNRRGGVLFRFYTRSRPTFASFCCKPSAISPSAARIARARRGDSICAVGPPNGVGWEIQKFAFNTTHQQHRGTAHLLVVCHLDVLALFRGFRQRSKRTFGRSRRDLPIHAVGPPIGVGRKIQKFTFNATHQQHRGTAHLLVLCHLDVLAFLRGFSHRSKRTFGRPRRDLAICPGFRGIGHPVSS